jgi:hypothetical protein
MRRKQREVVSEKGLSSGSLPSVIMTKLEKRLHMLFFIIPALFYFITACRTPGWCDSTMIVSTVMRLNLGSWVNTHNLFNLLGYIWLRIFPSGNIHFTLVLLSALFGTFTVHLVFLAGREMTGSAISAGIGALSLMVSHSLWWHSSMLEVYTLNTVILSAMMYCIIRYEKTGLLRYLCLSSFFFGLGCSNHMYMGLFIFAAVFLTAYMMFHQKKVSWKAFLVMAACFLLGISLYAGVIIQSVLQNAERLRGVEDTGTVRLLWKALETTLHRATGGDFKDFMFTEDMTSEKLRFWRLNYLFFLVYNFFSIALPLGCYGIFVFWKRKNLRLTFIFLVPAVIAQALWSANYFIWDMYAFALPVYVLFSYFIIVGADSLLKKKGAVKKVFLALIPTIFFPILLYSWVPLLSRKSEIFQRFISNYRELEWTEHTWDPIEYIFNPNKRHYDKVERYVEKLYSVLPIGAHLLDSDPRSDYPLRFYYRNILRRRTDIIHYSIFSPFLTTREARILALRIDRILSSGSSVYTSSVIYPEKAILDQLYLLYDQSETLEGLAEISTEEYLQRFPRVEFKKIVLFEDDQIWIYQMSIQNQ